MDGYQRAFAEPGLLPLAGVDVLLRWARKVFPQVGANARIAVERHHGMLLGKRTKSGKSRNPTKQPWIGIYRYQSVQAHIH